MSQLFFIRFLISNLVLAALFGSLHGLKRLFHKNLTRKTQYHLSLLFLVLLFLPFLPVNTACFLPDTASAISASPVYGLDPVQTAIKSQSTLLDAAIHVERASYTWINITLIALWILGMVLTAGVFFYHNRHLARIRSDLQLYEDSNVTRMFFQCKDMISLHKTIGLGYSSHVSSPIAFGFLKPCIVLPDNTAHYSDDDLKHILLHELYHCKQQDILINYCLCLIRLIYWFNPAVHYFIQEIKTEREILCDRFVISQLGEDHSTDYGMTLLRLCAARPALSVSPASQMSSSRKQLEKRIRNIAAYLPESRKVKMQSMALFLIAVICFTLCAPALHIGAFDKSTYSYKTESVTEEDLGSYFGEFEGSFVLYDTKNDHFTVHNKKGSQTRVTPASTYKIYSLLYSLDAGIISAEDSRLYWNGQKNPFESWNEDHDLYSAMSNSVTWYFQELDQAVGLDGIKQYLAQIDYGNQDVSGGIVDYWAESSLKISPLEQVKLLQRFHDNELGFSSADTDTVKSAIHLETLGQYSLYGKTGTSVVNNRHFNGWFTGYIETSDNTFYFAVQIADNQHADGISARTIALAVLRARGIYPESISGLSQY